MRKRVLSPAMARSCVATCLSITALLAAALAAAPAAHGQDRYALANGCYGLKSVARGSFVVKTADGGYRASAGSADDGERFRMQATALGSYLLYGRDRDFLARGTQQIAPEASTPLPLPLPVTSPPPPGSASASRARRARARPPTGPSTSRAARTS